MNVTIVVPSLDPDEKLAETVAGLRAAGFSDIILVDDGSPDSCGEMCERFSRNHANVRVLHQSNQGLSAARNTGIKEARGEYLIFPDSDLT